MKLKKILLASATVAAFSAVMSISALAANTITPEYTPATATKTAVVTVADAPVFTDGSSYTMLILNTNNGAVLTTIANTDIKQIGEEPVTYKNVEIPVGDLTAGATYEVRMGGDGNLWTGTFTVPKATPDNPWASSTRKLGDVAKDDKITLADTVPIINHYLESTLLTGEDLQSADVTDDGKITLGDTVPIINYQLDIDKSLDGKTVATKSTYVTETSAQ